MTTLPSGRTFDDAVSSTLNSERRPRWKARPREPSPNFVLVCLEKLVHDVFFALPPPAVVLLKLLITLLRAPAC